MKLMPGMLWRFVKVDVCMAEYLEHNDKIIELIRPKLTLMDLARGHRSAFLTTSLSSDDCDRLLDELKMNLERIWTQNLGRDEQIMSWFFGEVRYPILDMEDWSLQQQKWGRREEGFYCGSLVEYSTTVTAIGRGVGGGPSFTNLSSRKNSQMIMNVQSLKRIKVVSKYLPMGSGSMESILMSYSNLSYVQPSQFKDYITQVRGSGLVDQLRSKGLVDAM
ncbi:hypothetical protein BY996DRAFT_6622468 [Phakopsora pachyrhizi]|nr:hypothetical protein BY996DRAFT_6622468 [Phakopsora pachyrhizi]